MDSYSLHAMKQKKVIFGLMLLAFVGSVLIDQVSKMQAEAHLMAWAHPEDVRSYEGIRTPLFILGEETASNELFLSFSLNYVRNLGAAWGMLSNLPASIRNPFFFVITLIAVLVIVIYFRSTPAHLALTRWALIMILSGAIGNFLNRLIFGYVIDWIDVRWSILGWRYSFPNFNWADICISIGMVLLILDSLLHGKNPTKAVDEGGLNATN